jgi:hypothetical protein
VSEHDALCYPGLRAWPFAHKAARKYGLDEFYDPIISDWMHLGPEWNSGLVFGPLHGSDYRLSDEGGWEEVDAPHMVSLTFDLSRPLKAQLDEAAAELKIDQSSFLLSRLGLDERYALGDEAAYLKVAEAEVRAPKHHPKKWLTYLRALDARASGASLSQIAEILPNHLGRRDAKAAHNVLEQAEALSFRF